MPTWITWLTIALVAGGLLWVALVLHPIGDYFTESDFYGGYSEGARLIRRGIIDPSRYGAVGPVYEMVLALAGAWGGDLFVIAKLLSVCAALAVLLQWRETLARRLGSDAAWVGVLLLAANPTFFRYGYSATTDMLSLAFQAASLTFLLRKQGSADAIWAGVLAALASLTRYGALFLLPGALLYLGLSKSPSGRRRGRELLLYLAGFALLWIPWGAYSLARGEMPAFALIRYFGFYGGFEAGQVGPDAEPPAAMDPIEPPSYRSLPDVLAHDAPRLIAKLVTQIPRHAYRDAGELLGWPAMLLVVLGVAIAIRGGWWRRLLPIGLHATLMFAFSLPVFFSLRYALPLVPLWLALATPVAIPWGAGHRVWTRVVLAVLVATVVSTSAIRSFGYQRQILSEAPLEVLECSRALAHERTREARVVCRKWQVAHHSRTEALAFPSLSGLAELARYAHEGQATHLYYSWHEVLTRPQFAYLLDTTAVLPGLSIMCSTMRPPSVLYRIGPEFGQAPEWLADSTVTLVHLLRGTVRGLPDSMVVRENLMLGAYAMLRREPERAVIHAGAALRGDPRNAMAWTLSGDALFVLGRRQAAIDAYGQALTANPRLNQARVSLGRALRLIGSTREAALAWRPLISTVGDPALLSEMLDLFQEAGDVEAAAAVRARLQGARSQ